LGDVELLASFGKAFLACDLEEGIEPIEVHGPFRQGASRAWEVCGLGGRSEELSVRPWDNGS
jgi:hypothetical protein